jgi:hypothetical protein
LAALNSFIHEKETDVARHMQVVEHLSKEQQETLAQEFLNQAKRRFPMSGQPHLSQAKLYCKQGHFEKAAEALIHKQQYGKLDDQDISVVHQIRRGVAGNPLDASKRLFSSEQVGEILRRYTYERFLSLGETCEVGFLQRAYDREPPSLFRWGTMPRANMIKLFNEKFKDFAQIETSELIHIKPTLTSFSDGMELQFYDKNYDFTSHSGVNPKKKDFLEPESQVLTRLCMHFSMLARSLQDDLEDAEKFFIYQSRENLNDDQCIEFHDALCTSGNNKLLIVMRNHPEIEPFNVIRPNLISGTVSGWGDKSNYDPESENMRSWDQLIQTSYSHFLAHYPELNAL